MVLFGLDKKVKDIVLATLADGDIKKEVDKYVQEAIIRALRKTADDMEKGL